MSMTDPISDMLTRIRNAGTARHLETSCPASKMKKAVAEVLKSEGFLGDVREEGDGPRKQLVLGIRYNDEGKPMIDGLRRISRPGRKVYVGAEDVPRLRGGLGLVVMSTSRGIMGDRDARAAHIGGEVLCEVW